MTKLVKYWKEHIALILVIIGLLVVQAYCDLELPSYTADIVDVGITNSGIEHVAPEKMSSQTFDAICLFLDDEEIETLKRYYTEKENGIYKRTTDNEKTLDK